MNIPSCRSALDEEGKSEMGDVDEDFKEALQEQEAPSLDRLDSSDEDSEVFEERHFVGAGLFLGVAAAGFVSLFRSVFTRLTWSAESDDGDLGGVLADAVDVDDLNTAIALGSHANKASMQSTGNALGTLNVPSSTPLTPPPGVESAA
jgi:hypothetical protein